MRTILLILAALFMTIADVKAEQPAVSVNTEVSAEGAPAATSTPAKPDPISMHKINYFAMNRLPGDELAQVKFQFSVKYKLFNYDHPVGSGSISPFFAYSQKSLWNVGKPSMPFEESNYNPEFFLAWRVNARWGDAVLRSVLLSPYEHESNGLDTVDSRSWNRRYIAVRAGFFPGPSAEDGEDRAEFIVKLWRASGYYDQDNYLQALGSPDRFLDYAGRGEAAVVVRDVLISGDWGNQLNVTTRIFRDSRKHSYNLEYLQKIKRWNVRPYFQYWYGYNETLLRFDRFERRRFLGLSFSY